MTSLAGSAAVFGMIMLGAHIWTLMLTDGLEIWTMSLLDESKLEGIHPSCKQQQQQQSRCTAMEDVGRNPGCCKIKMQKMWALVHFCFFPIQQTNCLKINNENKLMKFLDHLS